MIHWFCLLATVGSNVVLALTVTVKPNALSVHMSGTARLVGGTNDREGRLEVYHDGVWGTVCDDYFTDAAARVACNSLGFG